MQKLLLNQDFSWRFNKNNDKTKPLDWKIEGKFYATERKDEYRLNLALDLVAPENLNLDKAHVLSFLFGTANETELIKCGWDRSNIDGNYVQGQTAAYFSRQHTLTPIQTMYDDPFFVKDTSVLYSWTTELPTVEKNRLKCRGSK